MIYTIYIHIYNIYHLMLAVSAPPEAALSFAVSLHLRNRINKDITLETECHQTDFKLF